MFGNLFAMLSAIFSTGETTANMLNDVADAASVNSFRYKNEAYKSLKEDIDNGDLLDEADMESIDEMMNNIRQSRNKAKRKKSK